MAILFESVFYSPIMVVANGFYNRKSKSIPGHLCIIRTETMKKCTGIKRYSIRRITDRKIVIAKQKAWLNNRPHRSSVPPIYRLKNPLPTR